ncbi:MAG: adenosylcobinamide-GDP ribazoletransferase [Candidatus Eremiobacteraeota bacterium]|nr:adenosylcobinamide-GDP ribazoletransferase [Candidatus Eremiobacteraeota bacterium]
MRRGFAALCSALAYFTILPIGRFTANVAPDPLAISFLPLIGAAVGALAGCAALLVPMHARAWWPVVAWIAVIMCTGAIHVDGFLDWCDGMFATATPSRRLEILTDPRHGTFALVGMSMLTAVWITAIARIPLAHIVIALAFSGTLARLAAIVNAWIFPYARAGAVTAAFLSRPNVVIVAIGVLVACALGWLLDPLAFAVVPVAIALSVFIGWWSSMRLGGLTGDVFGAIIVIVEVGALVATGLILT